MVHRKDLTALQEDFIDKFEELVREGVIYVYHDFTCFPIDESDSLRISCEGASWSTDILNEDILYVVRECSDIASKNFFRGLVRSYEDSYRSFLIDRIKSISKVSFEEHGGDELTFKVSVSEGYTPKNTSKGTVLELSLNNREYVIVFLKESIEIHSPEAFSGYLPFSNNTLDRYLHFLCNEYLR